MDASHNHDQTLLAWDAPEFAPFERGHLWHALALGFLAILVAYSLAERAFTFTAALLLLAWMFWKHGRQAPRMIRTELTELGVRHGNAFYPYASLQTFWLVYRPPHIRSLYLRHSQKKRKILHLELNQQDPRPVRQLLAKELPELEGAGQPLLDAIFRFLRLS